MDFSYSSPTTDQWLSEMEEQLDPTTFMITTQGFSAALIAEEDFSNSFSSTITTTTYPSFDDHHYPTTKKTNTLFSCSSMEAAPKQMINNILFSCSSMEAAPKQMINNISTSTENISKESGSFFSLTPNNYLISFGNNPNTSSLNIDKTDQLFYNGNNLASTLVKPKEEEASVLVCNSTTNVGTNSSSYENKKQQVYAFKGGAIQGTTSNSNNVKKENITTTTTSTNTMSNKPLSFSQEHVIAERKRRERLNHHFIALSALVPGLKKMDKATVLGDATKYLKELQERLKTLEDKEQATKNSKLESVILVKKSQLLINNDGDEGDDDTSSCKENLLTRNNDESCYEDGSLPEIEATDSSNKTISIRIHCKKSKGVLVKILAEIEKLHLTVVNSSVMPFGDSALYITAIAQMDAEYCLTMRDLVKNLRSAFRDHQ